MTLESILREIQPVSVDGRLPEASRESDYFRLAFDLMRETAQYVTLFASINYGTKANWNVQQAIVGGHFVRLYKLSRSLLDQINERREEVVWVILRLCAECIINVRFLLRNDNEETLQSYLHYSLQYEKEQLSKIDANIAARGGSELPIEKRMRRSILRAFERSGVTVDSLPNRRIRNWANKNLFEKATDVGLGEAYFAMISGPSRNVHGGWRDLLEHHLEFDKPGEFRPKLEFSNSTRPQALFAYSAMIVETLQQYVNFLIADELEPVTQRLKSLRRRIIVADRLHERFLQRRES
jgi:hypothetical protein